MKKHTIHLKSWLVRLILILVTIFMLYPVFWSVYSSFKTSTEFLGNPFSLPSSLEWNNYVRAVQKSNLFSNLKNSVYVVVVALILTALLVVPSSYCIARFRFFGKKLMKTLYMSMIFIQFSCIMIPLFLQMNSLHMLNKLTPLALLYAIMQVPFSVFLLGGFMEGIAREREEISFLKKRADYIIDTTTLLTRELKQEIEKIFVDDENFNNLVVTILSFGFKYGIPEDADLVFDVRFLPNPYYIDELKPLTGNDAPIKEFVMKWPQSGIFLDKLTDMIEFLIPNYIIEGKNRLVIAIGCTGGKHRSVTLANELYARLSGNDYGLKIEHRDIDLDARNRK